MPRSQPDAGHQWRNPAPEEDSNAVHGTDVAENVSKLAHTNHVLSRFISGHVLDRISASSSIGPREESLLAIMGCIATDGDTSDQLSIHISAALRHGATESEVHDLVAQASTFLGSPRALAAQQVVDETLRTYHPQQQLAKGYTEREIWLGDHHTMVRDSQPSNTADVPVILIHALALDRKMWDDVFQRLTTSDPSTRVISYDLRGHGHARAAPQVTSLDQLADDLSTLLTTLDIGHADVYGQSYGGAVAQYFGLRHSSATRSLGLVTTAAESQPSWATRATRAEAAASVLPLLPETLQRWFTGEAIARNEWGVRYARSCVERISLANWASAWRAMSGLDTRARLHELRVPVHVVCGKQDASTGPKWMAELAGACSDELVSYVELDPGVHMMALEQGPALAEEIVRFRARFAR